VKPFRLHEPTTIDEAVSTLSEHAETAKLYAGGTELLLAMKAGLLQYDDLINVKTIVGLDVISSDDGALVIGASATHTAIERSPLVREWFPLLSRVEHGVANVRVRNTGTLGGNLCFAEPHSDPGTVLLLFEAEAQVRGPGGSRTVAIDEMTAGPYETNLSPDELLTSVLVPPMPQGMQCAYEKFGYHHRPTLGIATAVQVTDGVLEDVRLALGCVSPTPLRLREAEAVLKGARVSALGEGSTAVAEAGRIAAAAADAIDDMHGSAEYKEHLVHVFLGRVLAQAIEAKEEKAP
jgi:carbon-monoxide dehydrogenase medium subunit